jgi:hypothetical protein
VKEDHDAGERARTDIGPSRAGYKYQAFEAYGRQRLSQHRERHLGVVELVSLAQGHHLEQVCGAPWSLSSEWEGGDLIAAGTYAIPGKTAITLSSDDALEFPCSWLTAITLYAGVGEIAWYYPLDRIDAIAHREG